jgi:hypothetical protein
MSALSQKPSPDSVQLLQTIRQQTSGKHEEDKVGLPASNLDPLWLHELRPSKQVAACYSIGAQSDTVVLEGTASRKKRTRKEIELPYRPRNWQVSHIIP